MKIGDTPTTTAPAAIPGTGGAFAGSAAAMQDEFLRLLVAQLKHQDPLDPQDGAAFVAELAQFASLEQQATTNARLQALEAQQATLAGTSLVSMVGRNVLASADTIQVIGQGSAPPPLEVQLARPATQVTVVIRDAAGNEVHRIAMPGGRGSVKVPWDGRLPDGTALPQGIYTIEATAQDSTGETFQARPVLRGVLDAIEFEKGMALLRFGQFTVTPADVVTIGS
ncbi:MAG: hypothetical protein HY698_11635 [Deltaproteobacteria bacterium]|nr:hypothetical protein [Deltaproteobacteria bacterium]